MILILSVCDPTIPLLRDEFVRPIADTVKSAGYECEIKSMNDDYERDGYDIIIICGTALKDNKYLEDIGEFAWIRECTTPILGICAGMQIIGLVHGCQRMEALEIGPVRLQNQKGICEEIEEVYALHQWAIEKPENKGFNILARSSACVQAIQKGKQVGILFHPEANNRNLIADFLEM